MTAFPNETVQYVLYILDMSITGDRVMRDIRYV